MKADYTIFASGDQSITVSFGNKLDFAANQKVFTLFNNLVVNKLEGWLELIPAYTTLTIKYDAHVMYKQHSSVFAWLKNELVKQIEKCKEPEFITNRQLRIPVCYDPVFGFDLKSLSKAKKLSINEVIELHTAQIYRVFMLGFLPGFAYMGIVDDKIASPRLSTPRKLVPVGSVGIAGNQTGIYPLDSPGGWSIIGRTPIRLFDSSAKNPVLFKPGDEVKFYPITKEEFHSFDQESFKPLSA